MTAHQREVKDLLRPIKESYFIGEEIPRYILDSVNDDVMKGIPRLAIELDLVLHLSSKNISEKKLEYVYLIKTDHGIKIGKSRSPEKRIHNISTKIPFKIMKSEYFVVENMSKTESSLHTKYKEYRLNGEWFNLTEKQYSEIKETLKPLFKIKEVDK